MNNSTYREIAEDLDFKFFGYGKYNTKLLQNNSSKVYKVCTIDDSWRIWKTLWKPGMRKRGATLITKTLVEKYGWNPSDFTIEIVEPYPNAIDNIVYLIWNDKVFE